MSDKGPTQPRQLGYPDIPDTRSFVQDSYDSLSSRIKPHDEEVYDPGDYFDQQINAWASFGTPGSVYNGVVMGTPYPGGVPDVGVFFFSRKFYNCIEINASCQQTARGWCVPDLFSLALNRDLDWTTQPLALTFPSNYITGGFVGSDIMVNPVLNTGSVFMNGTTWRVGSKDTCLVSLNGGAHGGFIPGELSGPNRWAAIAPRYNYQPAKSFIAPVAGDDTNTTSLFGNRIFQLLGLKPFRSFCMPIWSHFQSPHAPTSIGPYINVKAWYDPKQITVTSIS